MTWLDKERTVPCVWVCVAPLHNNLKTNFSAKPPAMPRAYVLDAGLVCVQAHTGSCLQAMLPQQQAGCAPQSSFPSLIIPPWCASWGKPALARVRKTVVYHNPVGFLPNCNRLFYQRHDQPKDLDCPSRRGKPGYRLGLRFFSLIKPPMQPEFGK